MSEQQQFEQAIAMQQTLRGTLPDAVVDATIAALREKLAAWDQAPRDEQRKLVTVLFADLVGWTAMSERMDAEDVRAIQQAYFAAVTPPILQHGGRVEKYIGDAILAVFGVPQAQETDPESAVRAALAMQQAMIALNHRLAGSRRLTSPLPSFAQPPFTLASDTLPSDTLTPDTPPSGPPPISLRIGLHTGPVLATVGPRADDFVVTGDTVNLAARLQAAAPPGGVLISHDTWRHVADLFDAEPQEPLALKGKAEPVRTVLIARARPRPFGKEAHTVAGIATRMVGREAELLTLQNTLQDVMADGELRLVTVVGEGGIGKSRLLGEFEHWVERIPETVWYFKGRASPEMVRQPYGLLRTMLAARFGIVESDTFATVRQKLDAGMRDFGVPDAATLVGQLLGYDFSDSPSVKPLLDDPKQLREQALAGLAKTFAALAAQGPVLILLEDLHWADDSSLDALNHLAQALTRTPVCVLAAARPDLYERRPYWGEGWAFDSRLDLRPLSKRATRELVAEILQRVEDVPESLQNLIVVGAEGNPFFVEELIKMLVDDGVIDATGDPWRVDLDKLGQAQIPATLTGVLQARLDRLPSEERTVLQQASVVGPVFWDRAVLACTGEHAPADDEALAALRATLHALRSRELVYHRETSIFANAVEHTFKHAILRDVTYESVLKRLRRVYHGLVADWLIEQAGERLDEFVGVIADHLERAGRTDEAIDYLLRAGDQARLVQAYGEAVQRYERAVALLEEKGAGDQAARIYMKLGVSHQNAFEHAKARQAFDRGFALWQRAAEELHSAPLLPAPHVFRVTTIEPLTLDPTRTTDLVDGWIIGNLFSGLVEPGLDFGAMPDVAKSWQVSDDGRTYVFRLRDDVTWSDGTPVTAGDFEYAWKRILRPGADARQASLWYDIKTARAYHRGELSDEGALGVHAVDDWSLVVELEQPVAYFLQLLATSSYPVPRHVVEATGERWAQPETIVTNGPYLLKTWLPGKSLTLARNPRYHGRFRGNVTQLEDTFTRDWPTTLAMYEADELDCVGLPTALGGLYAGGPFDPVRVRQRHTGEYGTAPGWHCTYLALNASRWPFDDPRVRRALALASNREALCDTVFLGEETPATGGFLPPEMPGHSAGIGLPYDPEQARRLLAEAGYPNGSGFPAIEACVVRGSGTVQIDFLAQQWRDTLGIEVTSVGFDVRSFLTVIRSALPPMSIQDWIADYPDPDNFLRVGLKLVRSGWQNETFERLIREAKQLTDQRARMELYRQADRLLVQEAVIVPLNYHRVRWLVKPWATVFYRYNGDPMKDDIIRPH